MDTHCHLHMDYYCEDRDEVIKRIEEEGCPFLLTVGIDIEDSRCALALAESRDYIWAAVGVHPHDASKLDGEALLELEKLAGHPKAVAVGEVGLDFYRNLSPRDAQFSAFEAQLELAVRLKKPVVIHTRDAHPETKEVLKKYGHSPVVIHCFSGTKEDAKDYLDLGCYISFAGHTTYPKNEGLRLAARYVPLDMMLVETDAPFLTPEPLRGKRNEPVYVKYTAMKLAQMRGISFDSFMEKMLENAKRAFAVDN